jgi:hypothetical protein
MEREHQDRNKQQKDKKRSDSFIRRIVANVPALNGMVRAPELGHLKAVGEQSESSYLP